MNWHLLFYRTRTVRVRNYSGRERLHLVFVKNESKHQRVNALRYQDKSSVEMLHFLVICL